MDRARAEAEGFLTRDLHGERPPLCFLAGWYDQDLARQVSRSVDEFSKKTSGAMTLWARMTTKVRQTLSCVPPVKLTSDTGG